MVKRVLAELSDEEVSVAAVRKLMKRRARQGKLQPVIRQDLADRLDAAAVAEDGENERDSDCWSSDEGESGPGVVGSTEQNEENGTKSPKRGRWINKQRCLVFSGRGISHRYRHLMNDVRTMLPHSKPEAKMDRKDDKRLINEICEMKNCNKCMFFEPRREHLYLWMTNVSSGPTAYFLVENVHSMQELRLTGNSLKGSRPLLVFDKGFSTAPHLQLIRELLTQVFGTPHLHPRSQPFVDHVLTFGWLDGRVWLRNYQIVDEKGALAEIGPRCALQPIKLMDGSFCGKVLWRNPQFVSPKSKVQMMKMKHANRHQHRREQREQQEARRVGIDDTVAVDVTDDIFTPA